MEKYTRDDIEFFNIFLEIKAKLDNYFDSHYFNDDLSPLFEEGFEKINMFSNEEFKTTAKSLLENIKYLYYLQNFANNAHNNNFNILKKATYFTYLVDNINCISGTTLKDEKTRLNEFVHNTEQNLNINNLLSSIIYGKEITNKELVSLQLLQDTPENGGYNINMNKLISSIYVIPSSNRDTLLMIDNDSQKNIQNREKISNNLVSH